MKEKETRFQLFSFSFRKLEVKLYDNLKKEALVLSIYELVDLLNTVSQSEYDLRNVVQEINLKLDEISGECLNE